MGTRAQFLCNSITERFMAIQGPAGRAESRIVFDATLFPITSGSPEDRRTWAANPGGQVQMTSLREKCFVPGKRYIVEIKEVE